MPLAGVRSMRPSVDVRRVVTALLVLTMGLAGRRPVGATTFVLMDDRDLAVRSVGAVLGTVRSVRSEAAAHGIATAVVIEPERVLFGTLPAGPLTLREPGGALGLQREVVFGSAEYHVGERVVAFLSVGADGSLRTTAMAMGKFDVEAETTGDARLTRHFGDDVRVLDPTSGRLHRLDAPDSTHLSSLVARLYDATAVPTAAHPTAVIRRVPAVAQAFTYLDQPSRWFEPDDGLPVGFGIDPLGDVGIGAAASMVAAENALAAWSAVAGSSLRLTAESLDQTEPFAGCDGDTRVVFNDPFDEIVAPVDCRGVVGVGGFCTTDETREVNGTSFRRIGLGKVLLARGFGGCPFWDACGVAEVLTHEIGHAIGFGHSSDPDATMWATPHFDGRCAALGADDIDGVRVTYPFVPPTPSPTATEVPATPTATRTARPTRTPTANTTPRRVGHSSVSGNIRYYGSALPVADAAVAALAAAVQRTTTTSDGHYVFSDIPDGGCAVQPVKIGDTGVAVSALDAAWVLQAVAARRTLTGAQQLACNVTGSGQLSALDAERILQRVIGYEAAFPATEQCGSEWLFFPDPAPQSGQHLVPPAFAADGCEPGALVFNPLQGADAGQDFDAIAFGDCTGNWQSDGDAATRPPSPAGTALDVQPLRARPGGRWMQAIALRAPNQVNSLEVELSYDATRMRLRLVRPVHIGELSMLMARTPGLGRVRLAIASADPLPIDGRPLAVVEFSAAAPRIAPGLVRAVDAVVDERQVALPAE
jgi:hypothetical protein